MTNWKEYWNGASLVHEEDFLRQVGKTVNGTPITNEQFSAIVDDIVGKLDLRPIDHVIDLCCGNGAITFQVAGRCRRVTAFDFSEPLIQVARQRFKRKNVEYVLADVCALPVSAMQSGATKVYMYEALQHFGLEETEQLLRQFADRSRRRPLIYLAAVPDAKRMENFYNTPARRAEYEKRKKDGTEPLGHWWDSEQLGQLLAALGYEVSFTAQPANMHGAHYRFDALCTPVPD